MTPHEEDTEPREVHDEQELQNKVVEPEQTEPEAIPLGPETQAIIIQSIN